MGEVRKVALRLTGIDRIPLIFTNKEIGEIKTGNIVRLTMANIENGNKKQKEIIQKTLFQKKTGFFGKPEIVEEIEISVFSETGGLCDTATNIDYQGFNAAIKIDN